MPDMNLRAIPVMRTALEQIQELHSEEDSAWDNRKICGGCSIRLSETLFPCETRKLADAGLADRMARTNQGENNE